jgi:DNA-binding transcriptional ArsR family regulator
VVKALSHPLRAAILERLEQVVLSPKELAHELGAPLSVISYHVQELHRLGLIELVRTEQRRGAVQHWYRGKVRAVLSRREFETDEQGFAELSAMLSETLARLDRIQADAGERLRSAHALPLHATVSLMLLDGGGE